MELLTGATGHTSIEVGKQAEKLAMEYLQSRGLKPLATNFTCRYGEIDLIMRERSSLVFIEVRYRKHNRFGSGAESVDFHKQQKLLKSAQYFLQKYKQYNKQPCRFDVVSISNAGHSGQYNIEWIPNAIQD